MSAEMPAERPQQERQSERRPLMVRVQYRRTIVRLAAQILDLSRHGLRLAGMERLRIGECVWITLPGAPSAATRWKIAQGSSRTGTFSAVRLGPRRISFDP